MVALTLAVAVLCPLLYATQPLFGILFLLFLAQQESLPSEPSDRDVEKAQAVLVKCLDACGNEYAGKVPKLKSDIEAALKKV